MVRRHHKVRGTLGCDQFVVLVSSARMANALEKAVQKAREKCAGGGREESEVTAPQAAVRQCYKGHRNTRYVTKH